MTEEQRKDYIVALLRERTGIEVRKPSKTLEERLAAIDAELARVGHEARTPAERAEKRPAPSVEKR